MTFVVVASEPNSTTSLYTACDLWSRVVRSTLVLVLHDGHFHDIEAHMIAFQANASKKEPGGFDWSWAIVPKGFSIQQFHDNCPILNPFGSGLCPLLR